jgi:NADH-quinone oxidoreductase subunit L
MENSQLYKFFMSGLGFDAFYDLVIIRPFLWIATLYKKDRIDKGIEKIGKSFSKINNLFQKTQNGQLNWYLTSIAIGIAIFLTLIILL